MTKDITESGVYTSSLFQKRGEVRNYAEIYAGIEQKMLASGVNVVVKKSDS